MLRERSINTSLTSIVQPALVSCTNGKPPTHLDTIHLIARVWSAIARARNINSFGLDHARLDRFQGLENPDVARKPTGLLRFMDTVFFGIPSTIHGRLFKLFNGRVVYQRHWGVFFDDLRKTWIMMGGLGALLVM